MTRAVCGLVACLTIFIAGFAAPTMAQSVNITPDESARSFEINGKLFTVQRAQDPENRIEDEFSKTSRACPPFCVHPMSAGPGVATIGELEVLDFLQTEAAAGEGLLIDSRLPEWYKRGTIPGAVNVPFATLNAQNPYRDEILKALGARQEGNAWDFSGATTLVMFCNGPWSDQSSRAIQALLQVGYPAEKMKYYRGGMQLWKLFALTEVTP